MLTYADVCWQLDELECALRTLGIEADEEELSKMIRDIDADGSGSVDFGQHASAYVSIRQHTSAYEHTSAYVSIRQHTSAY
jgi:Ca2+-binding EF-hand superfamily protein